MIIVLFPWRSEGKSVILYHDSLRMRKRIPVSAFTCFHFSFSVLITLFVVVVFPHFSINPCVFFLPGALLQTLCFIFFSAPHSACLMCTVPLLPLMQQFVVTTLCRPWSVLFQHGGLKSMLQYSHCIEGQQF